jgi:hypothetical protein
MLFFGPFWTIMAITLDTVSFALLLFNYSQANIAIFVQGDIMAIIQFCPTTSWRSLRRFTVVKYARRYYFSCRIYLSGRPKKDTSASTMVLTNGFF